MQPALSRAARGVRLLQGATILRLRHHHAHVSVDASPPRGSDSSSAQTHHGAASAAQSPAGAAAHMEKGGASERTPAARELGTGELGTARVVLASDTSRKSKTTTH